jgi:hypothetical protein
MKLLQFNNYYLEYLGEEDMLQRNGAVLWRELEGEAVLLDPAEGCTYNLNRVGTLIWKLLDGNHTTNDIASVICQEFEVEHEQALQDVEKMLTELLNNNLLLGDVSSPHFAT